MALTQLDVQGYRSLHNVSLALGQLNVVTGPNGSGKSNLYRALWLISRLAEGRFARSISQEGGLLSAMWAGGRANPKDPVRMSLGFCTDDLAVQVRFGFPIPARTHFIYDPQIKEEAVWFGKQRRPTTTLVERKNGMTSIRDLEGRRSDYPLELDPNESVLAQLREPHRFPELFALQQEMIGWRFYHAFRTDEQSLIRTPQVSVRTPVLSHDGCDLAAALQTIQEIGDGHRLCETIQAALPGRRLSILANEPNPTSKSPRYTELQVALETDGCARPLVAKELSDGTLKFLCLTAALLTPRPPSLIAFNEPESSLHPDLLDPLARLIVDASRYSQVLVTTHSKVLAERISQLGKIEPVRLELECGMTVIR